VTDPTYVTREEIESTLDVKPSAYMAREIDRACQAGSRAAEGFCHRIFYPIQATRTFDYPGPNTTALVLRLHEQELVSATTVTSDGVAITGYFLRPDIGPPFDRVEIDRNGDDSFSGGPQRAIAITGLWAGAKNTEVTETTLSAAITTTTATTMDINTCPGVGVGSVVRVDNERMIVTGKSFVTASLTVSALTSNNNSTSLTVTDGSLFTQYETLLIDSERVQVVDIAGNTLILRRAVGGTPLAAHAIGAQIYWQHRLQVERGALGTTAATHLISATVYRWIPPASVAALSRAYALDQFLQENSGYARTSGQGENERPVVGTGIKALESRVAADFKRKVRTRAI
jgi:hypothetical protein